MPFAIHFFSKAQLPGGGAILPLAEATEKLAGNATVIASKATFIIEVICMFIPIPSPGSILHCRSASASHCGVSLIRGSDVVKSSFCSRGPTFLLG